MSAPPTEAQARQIDSEWQADETANATDHDPHADCDYYDPTEDL